MVLESDGYGVGEQRSWCWRVMVMVLESDGHGVGEKRLWCWRVAITVLESNGYGVTSTSSANSWSSFCISNTRVPTV
jgi:hypothetical protein